MMINKIILCCGLNLFIQPIKIWKSDYKFGAILLKFWVKSVILKSKVRGRNHQHGIGCILIQFESLVDIINPSVQYMHPQYMNLCVFVS